MSAAAQWYYVSDEQQQGPVARDQLDGLLASGIVTGDTFVWSEGMPDWQPARETALSIDARPLVAPLPANGNVQMPQAAPAPIGRMRRFNRALALTCAGSSYAVVAFMGFPIVSVAKQNITPLAALQFADSKVGAASGVAVILGAAAFFTWSYRATRNLVALKGAQSVSPAGSVYWYLVPIWNFWKPLRAMNNLRKGFAAGHAWRVYLWWGLFWLSNLIDAGTTAVANAAGPRLTIDLAYALLMIANGASIAFYLAGAWLVLDISKAEQAAISEGARV